MLTSRRRRQVNSCRYPGHPPAGRRAGNSRKVNRAKAGLNQAVSATVGISNRTGRGVRTAPEEGTSGAAVTSLHKRDEADTSDRIGPAHTEIRTCRKI